MISVKDLSFSYREKPIFIKANCMVGNCQKVGLVGPNGAGKSTLFNLLMGREFPEEGTVTVQGSVELVSQEVKRDKILEGSSTIRNYLDSKYQYQNAELKKMLVGLEMADIDLEKPPHKLSGGQKTKLAIIRALLLEPDILLLDEPTNFLDIAGKKWIMNFLAHYPKTILLVSHDLNLLDQAIDKVIAIDIHKHTLEEYKGNYSNFVKRKKERDDLLKRQILNEQKHIARMKEGLQKMARFKTDRGVKQRTQLKRRIEKLETSLPDLPQEVQQIKLNLPEPSHVGAMPIMIRGVSKSFGTTVVLDNVSLSIAKGERIALIGPNGAGKSTLIKIALGLLTPDSGEIIKNNNLDIGYYSQEFEVLDMDKNLFEIAQEQAHLSEGKIRSVLGKFMFSQSKVFQKIETLSGGEKTRLAIALILLKQHNLLILDEPTTYLDVMSQRVILEALKKYQGAMLFVSHTPEFVEGLQPSRALLLPQNKIRYWEKELATLAGEI
ncbi:ABC-F family ATP-binding cassette domain-containing protein [Candidatus Beckwithbacteria bacterium]|nr:ABC-F family ATP-binding cassette domain-containing protein [Candidatus Beckwithbacteria bacterium]